MKNNLFIEIIKLILIISLIVFPVILFIGYKNVFNKDYDTKIIKYQSRLPKAENKPYTEFIGNISAYTIGNKFETDDEPCIGASNENMCEMAKKGLLMFANNYYKIGTLVCIETVGCGVIKDKMNKRYGKEFFDIAGLDKEKNINFGRRNLIVKIYKKYENN